MSRDDAYLLDIAKAARLIIEFTRGMDRDVFLNDVKTQCAVLHQLMLLGEAVKRLSPATRQRYSQIPWKSMAGMRDNLIHAYDRVDLNEVFGVATTEVPSVLGLLEPLLPVEDTPDGGPGPDP